MQSLDVTLLAKKVLINTGMVNPDQHQICKIETLLNNTIVHSTPYFDPRLSTQEKLCLLLAAYGQTAFQTAKLLDLSIETIKEYRKKVRRKLGSGSIAHAVYQGIHFGLINDQINIAPISRE